MQYKGTYQLVYAIHLIYLPHREFDRNLYKKIFRFHNQAEQSFIICSYF